MFDVMDEITIKITKINDLRLVHIYELTGFDPRHTELGCLAIAVFYGEDGRFNMNEMEPNFLSLLAKVIEVYKADENRSSIMMDDITRNYLENGIIPRHDDCLGDFYQKEKAILPRMLPDSCVSRRFMPLVEYILKGIYSSIGMQLDIIKKDYGWRGAATLGGLVNGDKEFFSFVKIQTKDDKRYNVYISNFIESNGELLIDIVVDFNRIELFYYSNDKNIDGHSVITLGKESSELHEIYHKGQPIAWIDEKLTNIADSFDEELIIKGNKLVAAISLPWKMKYILYEDCSSNGEADVHSYKSAFIYEEASFADIWCYSDILNSTYNSKLIINTMRIYRQRFKDNKIQTYFLDGGANSSGEYKKNLQGNFYID